MGGDGTRAGFGAAALLLVAGCAPMPDIGPAAEAAAGREAFPRLIPMQAILASAGSAKAVPPAPGIDEGRVAALRARAARLAAGEVVAAETRRRLSGARGGG